MKTENQFSSIIQNLSREVYTCDEPGFVKLYNKAAVNLRSMEPVTGRNLMDSHCRIFKSDGTSLPLDKYPMAKAIKEHGPLQADEIVIQPGKSFSHINPYTPPLFNEKSELTNAINILADVTEKEGSSEERYKNLVEHAADGIYLFDEQGNFISANISGCNMLGYTKEELPALNLADILPPTYTGRPSTELCNLKKGNPLLEEKKIMRKNGSLFFAEVSAQIIAGGIIQAIVRDITERKASEEKMLKAIERYDMLARATSDTIWDWDILNNKINYNDGITKMFGHTSLQINNPVSWWKKNIHPYDWEKVSHTLDEVFTNKAEQFQLSYLFKCADGSYKNIYDRAFVIFDNAGNPSRMIGAMQDVTYLRQEEIRIMKATLDAQENERQQIGFELHDNINQILTGCLLNLGTIKNSSPERAAELVEKSKEYILMAINETRKLSHRLAPSFSDNHSIKKSFEELIQVMNVNNQFTTKLHFDNFSNPDISYNVNLNLYRILQEQLTNIVKYSKATIVEISIKIKDNHIVMRTFDNGIGFKPSAANMGIGLSNMKKRIQVLSGTFNLNTAPGKGCEIIVSLPVENKTKNEKPGFIKTDLPVYKSRLVRY